MSKKVISVAIKVLIAALTVLGSYFGAAAQVNGFF